MIFSQEDKEDLDKVFWEVRQKAPMAWERLSQVMLRKMQSNTDTLIFLSRDKDTFRYIQGVTQVFSEFVKLMTK